MSPSPDDDAVGVPDTKPSRKGAVAGKPPAAPSSPPKRRGSKKPDAPPGRTRIKDKKRGNPNPQKNGGGKNARIRKTDQRRKGNVELGAPLRLTPEVQRLYVDAIRRGQSRTHAAHSAGIDPTSGNNWLKWGSRHAQGLGRKGSGQAAPEDKVFADFFHAVTQAEAQHEADLLASIQTKGDETRDWKADLAILERRHRQDWARKVEIHATVEDAEPEADRIADAILGDPDLANDVNAILGRLTLTPKKQKNEPQENDEP